MTGSEVTGRTVSQGRAQTWAAARRAAGDSPGRNAITLVAIVVSWLALAVSLAGIHGPVRGLLALLFVALVPGWAVMSRLDLRSVELEISLTIAIGLALEALVSLAMLYSRQWHPMSAQAIITIAANWSLLLRADSMLHDAPPSANRPRGPER